MAIRGGKFIAATFVFVLLGGCAHAPFNSEDSGTGLSGMAEENARMDCQRYTNYEEYRGCIARVNDSYEKWREQKRADDKPAK